MEKAIFDKILLLMLCTDMVCDIVRGRKRGQ